jgi:aminobenzoyl-glutamate utilization protein B
MYIPAKPAGALAGHHWSSAIGPATPVAHKGIAVGSKALAASIIDLMTDAKALANIRSDWTAEMARWPKWRSLIPDSSTPPIHLNTEEMATYRTALKQFEYDPNSKKTYLEFMGAAYPPKEPSTDIGRRSNLLKPEQRNSSIDWDWTKQ